MESTSTAAEETALVKKGRGLITALVVLAASACIVLLLWVLGNARQDPYIRATLDLQGSADHGGQLSGSTAPAVMVWPVRIAGAHAQGNYRRAEMGS